MTMEDNTSGHHHHHHHGGHRRTPNTPRDHDIQVPVNIIKTEREVCCSCGMLIQDRYLLKVNGSSWHAACLRCCVCQTLLERQPSCFVRGERVYCRADYIRQFGAKCAKCSRTIHASDWVRRAREQVYHLACFACDACKRQLSTGEEFALHENRVLCKAHYLESLDAAAGSGSNDETGDGEGQQKAKTKRVRTTFTEEQLQVLQANFNLDSNPDGQDLERIAQITGLSKRVTQVWFQNSRARQKKYLNNQVKKVHGGVLNVGGGASPCPGCGVQQLYCLCPASSVHMTMSQVA